MLTAASTHGQQTAEGGPINSAPPPPPSTAPLPSLVPTITTLPVTRLLPCSPAILRASSLLLPLVFPLKLSALVVN